MKRIDLILDVDTGVDDALALLLAVRHPAMRLRAVTCVAGNAGLDDVVRNTLGVLAVAGATGIPVGAGAERPLIAPHRPSVLFHGAGGLGGIAVPQARRRALPHAIDLMRKTIAASRAPLTLVALGPLTNVALLVRTAPHLARRLARIVFMGGSAHVGNATPIAEFNAWGDPEALAIVLSAGCPITMYGLDVFFDAIVTPADVRALADSPKRAPRLAGRLLSYLNRMGQEERRVAALANTTLGDAGTVAAVIAPTALKTARLPVGIVLDGHAARGQTIVDRRARKGEGDHGGPLPMTEIDVALGIDAAALRRVFMDALLGH